MSTTPVPVDTTPLEEPDELEELDETPAYSLLSRLGAEVFGTFVLVFLGVGAALFSIANSTNGGGLGIPLAFGIAVIAAASAVGHVSGGHFNPAVTLGAAVAGRTSWADVLPYWLAQVIGGALAAAALFLLIPSSLTTLLAAGGQLADESASTLFAGTLNGFDQFSPLSALTNGQATFGILPALLVEIIGTAIFVGVILGVTDKRVRIAFAPVAIGLTLAMVILVAAPITNASINPARSTASAIFSGEWGQLWLFWVAPLFGAALAALIYRIVTLAPAEDVEELEVEAEHEAEEELAEDLEADAIDALLARQAATAGAAAAVPAELVDLEEIVVDIEGVESEDDGEPTRS